MKGKEIINYIHRDKMPDIERVREKCHGQPGAGSNIRRLRWSTVAAVAACLLFASAVYAAGIMVYERFDTGGSTEYVFVPYDSPEYQERLIDAIVSQPIYYGRHFDSDYSFPYKFEWYCEEETAHFLIQMLAGKVFTSDGGPFELMTVNYDPFNDTCTFKAGDRGNVLYNADGCEISIIYLDYVRDKELRLVTQGVTIMTIDEYEERFGFHDSYEDAAALFGRDIRLPAVHMERFETPMFQVWDTSDTWRDGESGEWLFFKHKRVQVWFPVIAHEWSDTGMYLIVEKERNEHTDPLLWYIPGGIEEFEITGTAVHKITSQGYAVSFNWIHDGLVYILYPTNILTDEQIKEIIRSMIDCNYS